MSILRSRSDVQVARDTLAYRMEQLEAARRRVAREERLLEQAEAEYARAEEAERNPPKPMTAEDRGWCCEAAHPCPCGGWGCTFCGMQRCVADANGWVRHD